MWMALRGMKLGVASNRIIWNPGKVAWSGAITVTMKVRVDG